MILEKIKKVHRAGNSLVITLTKELRVMDIDEGDLVRITVEKVKRV